MCMYKITHAFFKVSSVGVACTCLCAVLKDIAGLDDFCYTERVALEALVDAQLERAYERVLPPTVSALLAMQHPVCSPLEL